MRQHILEILSSRRLSPTRPRKASTPRPREFFERAPLLSFERPGNSMPEHVKKQMAKRHKILKNNETTIKFEPTQWIERILPFISPRGKFSGSK
jgi:hypothetical protein